MLLLGVLCAQSQHGYQLNEFIEFNLGQDPTACDDQKCWARAPGMLSDLGVPIWSARLAGRVRFGMARASRKTGTRAVRSLAAWLLEHETDDADDPDAALAAAERTCQKFCTRLAKLVTAAGLSVAAGGRLIAIPTQSDVEQVDAERPPSVRHVKVDDVRLARARHQSERGHRQVAPMATADIVDTAVAAGDFTTLATALGAAGLVDTLKGPGPFTVFAPTDAAFAKLPAGTLDSLLANADQLRAVLTYHVVAGADTAADVSKLQKAATVQGEDVLIQAVDGVVQINDATVTTADIMASNGIIHVIDTVLLPPSLAASLAAQ